MAFYAAIDYSMSSPAITVGQSTDYSKCKSFFYTTKKTLEGKHGRNIYGTLALPYETEMERFNNIGEWTISVLKWFTVTEVCIEGYSMGSKGNVFNIGENTGILKHMLWKNGHKYHVPAPTQIKKHFTGKGNSNKTQMHDAFVQKTGVDLTAVFGKKADSNPISDVVDSYAILDCGFNQYF